MNALISHIWETDILQDEEYDVSELLALSKDAFRDTSTNFLKTYKLRCVNQEWGFILIGEGNYAFRITLKAYRPEIEYLNLRSLKEFNEPLFLTWYLMLRSRDEYFYIREYDLLQERSENRRTILHTMWKRMLLALELYCGDLLSGKTEDMEDFKVELAFTLEKLKETLIRKL